jgi:hypothetical protein
MKKYYYILTTEKCVLNYESKSAAIDDYKLMSTYCKHLRLERADAVLGTAKIIKEHNNIW